MSAPTMSFQYVESVQIKHRQFRQTLGHSQDFDTVELVATDKDGRTVEITLYTTAGGLKNLEATE